MKIKYTTLRYNHAHVDNQQTTICINNAKHGYIVLTRLPHRLLCHDYAKAKVPLDVF